MLPLLLAVAAVVVVLKAIELIASSNAHQWSEDVMETELMQFQCRRGKMNLHHLHPQQQTSTNRTEHYFEFYWPIENFFECDICRRIKLTHTKVKCHLYRMIVVLVENRFVCSNWWTR